MLRRGDWVFLVLKDSYIKQFRELEIYNMGEYEIETVHRVKYGTEQRKGIEYPMSDCIYTLKGVKSKKGQPYWFTKKDLHMQAPSGMGYKKNMILNDTL